MQSLQIDAVTKYIEFQTDAIWTKGDGSNHPCCFLVMELIEGVELIDFFNAAKPNDERYLRYIFLQIASSLHRLHSSGVAHRDIKPENIMLTDSFDIKLIDLGYGINLSGNL